MSSILIQYTTQSPLTWFVLVLLAAFSKRKTGGDASTLAAFSAVAILLGRNLASSLDFFIAGDSRSTVGDVLRSLFVMRG